MDGCALKMGVESLYSVLRGDFKKVRAELSWVRFPLEKHLETAMESSQGKTTVGFSLRTR